MGFGNWRIPMSSDPGTGSGRGRTNYGFCVGDSPIRLETGDLTRNNKVNSADEASAKLNCRGIFGMHLVLGFRDALDGTANTVALGELNY